MIPLPGSSFILPHQIVFPHSVSPPPSLSPEPKLTSSWEITNEETFIQQNEEFTPSVEIKCTRKETTPSAKELFDLDRFRQFFPLPTLGTPSTLFTIKAVPLVPANSLAASMEVDEPSGLETPEATNNFNPLDQCFLFALSKPETFIAYLNSAENNLELNNFWKLFFKHLNIHQLDPFQENQSYAHSFLGFFAFALFYTNKRLPIPLKFFILRPSLELLYTGLLRGIVFKIADGRDLEIYEQTFLNDDMLVNTFLDSTARLLAEPIGQHELSSIFLMRTILEHRENWYLISKESFLLCKNSLELLNYSGLVFKSLKSTFLSLLDKEIRIPSTN